MFEVSEGNQVTMPTYLQNGLSIKTVANLKAELQNLGVAASDITVEYIPTTDQNADGYVIRSTPAQGETFNIGDKIVLSVLQFDANAADKASSESASKSASESAAESASKSKSEEEASKSSAASSSSSSVPSTSSTAESTSSKP